MSNLIRKCGLRNRDIWYCEKRWRCKRPFVITICPATCFGSRNVNSKKYNGEFFVIHGIYDLKTCTSNIYLHVVIFSAFSSVLHFGQHEDGGEVSRTWLNICQGLARVCSLPAWKFTSATDVFKLLPWRFQTFAVAFSNFCRGVFKLLPWCLQTFAVESSNFCRDVFKLLPC